MLKHWLTLIAGFFVLGVAAGEPAPGASEEPPAEEDDPNLDLDLGALDDEPPAEVEPDHKAEAAAAKKEAKELREKNERYERELGEARQQRQSHSESDEDKLRRDEDAKLSRAETPELEKWQIKANRELRAGRTQATQALAQAQDIADKTTFSLLATKEPVLFKRYEARVEEELAKVRAKGQNAPREAIYTFLLGQDMRAGKLTKKKAAPAAPGADSKQVPRGKLPGARSDVNARSGMSEREKRAKRLENVQI